MAETEKPEFDAQYGTLVKEVFRDHVAHERAGGADLAERARHYVKRGKPDFVLAYLVETDLGNGEKRELLAQAFERRAEMAEGKAAAMDAEFARPFPLIGLEARKDRTMARQVREGRMIRPYARAPRPLGMQ